MKLSVPRSSAYNLASGTQSGAGTGDGEGREGREGSATRRFTTIAHNVVCSQRDLTEIFIVPLPLCLCPLVSLFPPPLENRDFHRNLAESRARDLRDATPRVPFGKRHEKGEIFRETRSIENRRRF